MTNAATPNQVLDLSLSLKSGLGVEKSSGVAAANNETVQFLLDQSGNVFDVYQNIAGNRPTFHNDIAGFIKKQLLHFIGNNARMISTNDAVVGTTFFVYQHLNTNEPQSQLSL